MPQMLVAQMFAMGKPMEIVLAGPQEQQAAMLGEIRKRFLPNAVVMRASQAPNAMPPIDGRASRNNITVGNLVAADTTLLTTIVSQDPMHVYFDVDEATMLHIQEMIREGKFASARPYSERRIACVSVSRSFARVMPT